MIQASEIVRLEGVGKSYGALVAVRDVTVVLAAGEVRALLGENGAGKTTLMNILYGIVRPDAGRVVVHGEDVTAQWSPRRAIGRGIGMIHQHFSLVVEHSVLENVVMPALGWRDLRPDWKAHRARVERLCREHEFTLPLDARVETLSVGERQQVEILKMLAQGARVLILDEPTSVLTPQQADTLLDMLRRLAEQGHAVVLITHKLREALAIATRITVMRQGEDVATLDRAAATPEEVAALMINQRWLPPARRLDNPRLEAALEVSALVIDDGQGRLVDDVSLAVRAGEIVGIAGVAGNGQTDLVEALAGWRLTASGTVHVAGHNVTARTIRERQDLGLACIPEDRHRLGLVLDMTVADNLVLDRADAEPFCRLAVRRRARVRRHAGAQVIECDIRTPGLDVRVAALSGGNQQKIVLSRALSRRPRVIVAAEPTRGLDFGATEYVRRRLVTCATEGVGILLVSSDLEELMELCHRVAVMYRGRIVGELSRAAFDPHRFGVLMSGLTA